MEYKRPLMKDVYNSESRELFTVISTFAGCGGSSTGYRLAGGKILCINEFIPAAIDTYRANYPYTPILSGDIRTLKPEDFMEAGKIEKGELDLFDGSPPCASFSISGKREKHWGKKKKYSDTEQRTDDLFFEYSRILKGLQPKTFVAENVKGLTLGTAKEILGSKQELLFDNQENTILKTLENCGYRVQCAVLDAADYGVPQRRNRVIFIGIRNDFSQEISFPYKQNTYITVKDAISNINNTPSEIQEVTIPPKYSIYQYLVQMKEGESASKYHPKGSYFNAVRNSFNRPANTVLQSHSSMSLAGSSIHPTENRIFTIKELKSVSSFPEDFKVTGTFAQQWERIGRAVPPLMMKAIAENIYEKILKPIKESEYEW